MLRIKILLATLVAGVLALAGCGADTGTSGGDTTVDSDASTSPSKEANPAKDSKPKVTFRVWGEAPNGVDITYGSDSSNRAGGKVPFKKSLRLDGDALYYQVTAQLQGGGDIKCSVKIGDQVKKGSASGGYNICSAQLNAGLLGGWD